MLVKDGHLQTKKRMNFLQAKKALQAKIMQVSGEMVLFRRIFGAQVLKIILKIAIYAVSDAKAFCAIIQKTNEHCGQLSMKDIKGVFAHFEYQRE